MKWGALILAIVLEGITRTAKDQGFVLVTRRPIRIIQTVMKRRLHNDMR
jgi:phage terminase large subunit-like protein